MVALIQAAMDSKHKKIYIDLGIHLKQFKVKEIWELGKNEKGNSVRERVIELPEESITYGSMKSLKNVTPMQHKSD